MHDTLSTAADPAHGNTRADRAEISARRAAMDQARHAIEDLTAAAAVLGDDAVLRLLQAFRLPIPRRCHFCWHWREREDFTAGDRERTPCKYCRETKRGRRPPVFTPPSIDVEVLAQLRARADAADRRHRWLLAEANKVHQVLTRFGYPSAVGLKSLAVRVHRALTRPTAGGGRGE